MRITIHSRLDGPLSFWMPDNGGYVRIERDHDTGTLGQQICYGGYYRGNTVSSTPDSFPRDVRRWYRAYRRNMLKA